ncbi:hypothetical protein [Endozoicomonas arenosclerae]|uniref:hypothetical protein n=1 Tax=Endozoicomonas arenosclerae TaxID=1633495 RepID=UPI0007836BA9|nr:hypothetical protein [Endozoicomonas arenosclerae]
MSFIEIFYIACGFLFLLSMVLFSINAIYFYRRHYKDVSELVDGVFYDCGLMFATHRLSMWGHYCLFPKRAERDNVLAVFEELPKNIRRQLIFHYLSLFSGGGFLILSALLAKYSEL